MLDALFTSPRKKRETRDARELAAAAKAAANVAAQTQRQVSRVDASAAVTESSSVSEQHLTNNKDEYVYEPPIQVPIDAKLIVQMRRGEWAEIDPHSDAFVKSFREILVKVLRRPAAQGRSVGVSFFDQLRRPNHAEAAKRFRALARTVRLDDNESLQLAVDNAFDVHTLQREREREIHVQSRIRAGSVRGDSTAPVSRQLFNRDSTDQSEAGLSRSWRVDSVGSGGDKEPSFSASVPEDSSEELLVLAIQAGIVPPGTGKIDPDRDMDAVLRGLSPHTLDQVRSVYQAVADANPAIAVCLAAAARSEHARKNYDQEALDWMDAARVLRAVEVDRVARGGLTLFHEEYTEAVEAFLAAARIHIARKRFSIASQVFCELATMVAAVGRHGEAAEHFQKAAELCQTDAPVAAAKLLQSAVECHFCVSDFKGVCSGLVWIIKLVSETLAHAQLPLFAGFSAARASEQNAEHATDGIVNDSDKLHGSLNQEISAAGRLLVESRVSIVIVLCLMGDFSQAHEFAEQLRLDAAAVGSFSVSSSGNDEAWENSRSFELQLLLFGVVSVCENRAELGELEIMRHEIAPFLTIFQQEMIDQLLEEGYKYQLDSSLFDLVADTERASD